MLIIIGIDIGVAKTTSASDTINLEYIANQ
jgi:hypothetical protein